MTATKNKFYKFLAGAVVPALKSYLKKSLRSKAVKLALRKILGSAVVAGPLATVIAYLVGEVFDDMANPLINRISNKLGAVIRKWDGEELVLRVKKAREDNDQTNYDSGVDDIYSS